MASRAAALGAGPILALIAVAACSGGAPMDPKCGDYARDPGEMCDGSDLGGASCQSLGHSAGTLACTSTCTFDVSGCGGAGFCGDGVVGSAEQCDGEDLAEESCTSLGYEGGSLGCTSGCLFDRTGCTGSACGNGALDIGEPCDGDLLGGATCESRGHLGGTLACSTTCTFDESGCVDSGCGDGDIDMGEECDGLNFGGVSCQTLGYVSGSLLCSQSCVIDESGCSDCGDGTLDIGEACDGAALGGESCLSLGHDGGDLACGIDCSFDESGCTDCGDGQREGAELCDGADVDGMTCQTHGFDGGAIACASTCDAWNETGCCNDACPALNDTRCSGTSIQTCVQSGACLAWSDTTDCAPQFCGGQPPACMTSGTGSACNDVYLLNGRTFPHTVAGLWASGAIPNPGSCQTGAHPLYLAYTLEASSTGRLVITVTDRNTPAAWPQISAFSSTQSGQFCNVAMRTELGCTVGNNPTTQLTASTASMSPGDTVYFIVSGSGLSYPLLDPSVTVEEVDCSQPSQVTLLAPSPPTNVHPKANVLIDFAGDPPLQNAGLVRIYEDSLLVATYNLVTAPPQVSWNGSTMIVDPDFDFTLGATVTVRYDLIASLCSTAIAGSFDLQVTATQPSTGETCAAALPLVAGTNTVSGTYDANTLDVLTAGLVTCYPTWSGTVDTVFSFTLAPPNTAVEITIDKSAENRLVMVLLDDCASAVTPLACASDFYAPTLTLTAGGLTPGATYSLVIGNAYSGSLLPDPGLTEIQVAYSVPVCGDGAVQAGETCDDGDLGSGDGCSGACQIEAGWSCSGSPSVCVRECGNGTVTAPEQCDDGDSSGGDGCSATCLVEAGWSCTGSPSVCTRTCGNGTLATPEQCDDGDAFGGDGCSSNCLVEPGWSCTGSPSTCTFVCGNGTLDLTEQCDDFDSSGGDGCSATCQVESGYYCYGTPSTCTAAITLMSEEFTTWVPTNWSVEDGGATTESWAWCNGCAGVGDTGGAVSLVGANGAYTFVDDDTHGIDIAMVEGLVTRSFSTLGYPQVRLQFRHYFRRYMDDVAEVQVSVNGGAYTTVRQYLADTANGAWETLDLTALAANQASVRLRFHYDDMGAWGYYWLLDSVRVVGL